MKKKLYNFKDKDSDFCYDLARHLREAKEDGLKEITLIESIPASKDSEFFWCTIGGCAVEKQECKKSQCDSYSKHKSNTCEHRGRYFEFCNYIKFDVETGREIKS